ncbi:MAG TPA: hypothetical protein VF510_11825 [Ktedonobacterales bacterium]
MGFGGVVGCGFAAGTCAGVEVTTTRGTAVLVGLGCVLGVSVATTVGAMVGAMVGAFVTIGCFALPSLNVVVGVAAGTF